MIGYIVCDGLIAFQRYRITLPEYSTYRITPSSVHNYNTPAPKTTLELAPLTNAELIEEFRKHGASTSAIDHVKLDSHSNPWRKHVYLILKFPGTGWAFREIGVMDLFFDALRLYTGASISSGHEIHFAPTKGKYKPLRNAGMSSYTGTGFGNHGANIGYLLTDGVIEGFKKFLKLYIKVRKYTLNETEIKISHRYFERTASSNNAPPLEDMILFYTIALEALFSPSEQHELSHRVAEHCSFLLGKSPKEIDDIYRTVKKAYDIRSKVAHGAFKDFRSNPLPEGFYIKLNHIVRSAIIAISNIRSTDTYKNKSELCNALSEKVRGINHKSIPYKKDDVLKYKATEHHVFFKWLGAQNV